MKERIVFFSVVLVFSLFIEKNHNLFAQGLAQDSLALVALYDSTDGANWTDNTNWLTGPVSTWYGITVSGGRVTEIVLNNNNLVGTLPPQIGNLTELTTLGLNNNQLTGSIPSEIGNLTNLVYFYPHNNQLSGSIPAEIGNLVNLEYLYLSNNQLSGTIPAQIGQLTKLVRLFLGNNQLEGSIPQEIGNLTSLKELFIDLNELEGSIPTEIGNLTNLTDLHLANNQLTGSIPTEIGNLTDLKWLTLHNNQLTDSIPSEIGNLTGLTRLILYNNQLSGAIPGEMINLTSLQIFSLSENRLTDLPDFSSIATLIDLQIQNNRFTFEDIEPNIDVPTFIYSPQDSVGTEQDTTVNHGSSLTLSVSVGGTANQYQWTKDGEDIPGADSSAYTISSAAFSDSGSYGCRMTNSIATELTLYSRPINVTVEIGVGIAHRSTQIPEAFVLHQNYPNPFNPSTTIRFSLPKANFVTLKVYNLLGKEIETLVKGRREAGVYDVEWTAKDLPSGLYLYRLDACDFVETKKLVLQK